MRMRVYRGNQVEDVLRQVRNELGDSAVIVNTRELPDAQIEIQALPPSGPTIEVEHALPAGAGTELQHSLEAILASQGLDYEITQRVSRVLNGLRNKPARADLVLSEVLASVLQFDPVLPKQAKAVAFIGATGVGKTTTIAKLAARLQRAFGLRIGLISIDNYRIGAGFQLQTYGSLLTIPCEVLDPAKAHAESLRKILVGMRALDLILIDTPGCSPRDRSKLAELSGLLKGIKGIERMLVLPAPTHEVDLFSTAKAFAPLGYSRTIITKLDESGYIGPVINVATRLGFPLSFFTTGQRVPEDIEPANARRLGWMLTHTVH